MHRSWYINWQRNQGSRQNAGSSSAMKSITSSTIVRCVCVLLLHGLGSNVFAFSNRILYGEVANPADFKFIVHLNYHQPSMDWRCGGSVIAAHFILTAAHCFDGRECDEFEISPSNWVAGDGPTYWAKRCHINDLYKSGQFHHDIALVETKEDLLRNRAFGKINLPSPGAVYPIGTPAVVAGWGKTESFAYADVLLQANVQVSDWVLCNEEYKSIPTCGDDMLCPTEIPANSFCTLGEPPNIAGTCTGDSGGPVIIKGAVAGIVSGVILLHNECEIGSPSLHVNVAQYIPWIMEYVVI